VQDSHREAIRVGAIHYAELAHSYRSRGFARPFPATDHAPGITSLDPGPMTYAEWGRLLGTLAEGPDAVAERLAAAPAHLTQRPASGRWNALEVVGHLRDADRDVYLPRLELVLTQHEPAVPNVDLERRELVESYDGLDPAAVLTEWRTLRARLLARLAPLGRADWARVAIHSSRGAFPLADMVRGWVEHDLSHRRQLALALGLVP
jgi:DinB superfamily